MSNELNLDQLEALAKAAHFGAQHVGEWPNVYKIADGITLDEFANFIAALRPDIVLALIAMARRAPAAAVDAEEQTQQSHVALPTRGTGGQHDAGASVLSKHEIGAIMRKWQAASNSFYDLCRAIEAEVASRCRAQGGVTSNEAAAELARKLVVGHGKTISNMYCDGEPIGRMLIACLAPSAAQEGKQASEVVATIRVIDGQLDGIEVKGGTVPTGTYELVRVAGGQQNSTKEEEPEPCGFCKAVYGNHSVDCPEFIKEQASAPGQGESK